MGEIQTPRCSAGSMDAGLESMAKWPDSLPMLDESPPEIGVAGEWVRDVILVRSKLRGAGADSKMLVDVGPEMMAKGDASEV